MDINEIISFNTGEEYVILDRANLNNKEYLYCVGIENSKPTEDYVFFKLENSNNEQNLEVVIDENELSAIINLFTNNYVNKNEEQDV